MPFIAIALVIAVMLGGGASVAAQSALPGDALWGFKVGVNEQVEAALAAEGKAQADFDIKAIEARMKEAATLSAEARLNAETRTEIEQNFEAHVQSVQDQIAKLEAGGDYSAAADIAARFQAALATNASVLSDAGVTAEASTDASTEAKEAARTTLNVLMVKVRSTLDAASTLSADASAKAATNGSTSQNTDDDSSAGASGTVQTGTSVRGGTGGIQVDSETGSQIAI